MFTDKPKPDTSALDEAINNALKQLDYVPAYSDEYIRIISQIEKLNALRTEIKKIDAPQRVSPDTLAVVLGNLLGIVFIVGHERANVVTSKALNFVMKASR